MIPARSAESRRNVERDLEQLRPGLLVLVRTIVGTASEADDICNEAIRIVLERLRREPLESPDALPAYLAQTARNLAIDERRRSGRRRTRTGQHTAIEQFPDATADPAEMVESQSRSLAVRRILEELPTDRDRRLLVRHYLEDADKEAVCREFGLTPEHFNRVVFRARNRLRKLIDRLGGDDDL